MTLSAVAAPRNSGEEGGNSAEIRSLSPPSDFDRDDGGEKEGIADFEGPVQDEETPIVYHYLNFDTELPAPSTLPTEDRPAPPPPNLAKYTSPFEWSNGRKTFIVWLSCIATAFTAFSAGSYTPGVAQMSALWGVSDVAALVGITTFTCGFAVAPMVLAPFSEINGRKPVFIVTGILFVICQLCCAVTRSYGGFVHSIDRFVY